MSQKRSRSTNWDEEEKQLLRSVLKDYAAIIENKSMDSNTTKTKNKAWQEVHKQFNELNGRPRELGQLKIQWKTMKINARKSYSNYMKQTNKTGGGERPKTPCDSVCEIKDLLNPAELLRDHNIYDSDGIILSLSTNTNEVATTSGMNVVELQETKHITHQNEMLDAHHEDLPSMLCVKPPDTASELINMNYYFKDDDTTVTEEDCQELTDVEKCTEPVDRNEYVNDMFNHSKKLKDALHEQQMQHAKEEHAIKMAIHHKKLKCAILEEEILQLKKKALL